MALIVDRRWGPARKCPGLFTHEAQHSRPNAVGGLGGQSCVVAKIIRLRPTQDRSSGNYAVRIESPRRVGISVRTRKLAPGRRVPDKTPKCPNLVKESSCQPVFTVGPPRRWRQG